MLVSYYTKNFGKILGLAVGLYAAFLSSTLLFVIFIQNAQRLETTGKFVFEGVSTFFYSTSLLVLIVIIVSSMLFSLHMIRVLIYEYKKHFELNKKTGNYEK